MMCVLKSLLLFAALAGTAKETAGARVTGGGRGGGNHFYSTSDVKYTTGKITQRTTRTFTHTTRETTTPTTTSPPVTTYNPAVYFQRPALDAYLETYYPQVGYKPYVGYESGQDCGGCSQNTYEPYMEYLRTFKGYWFDEESYGYPPLYSYGPQGNVIRTYKQPTSKYNPYWTLGSVKYGKQYGTPDRYAVYYKDQYIPSHGKPGKRSGCCWQFKKKSLPKRGKLPKPKKHTRCEYRTLTTAQRQSLHKAMNKLKTLGIWDNYVSSHRCAVSPYAHGGASFLPWHREFLFRLERDLFDNGYTGPGLPYWDSTLDYGLPNPYDSALWTSSYLGNKFGPTVTGFAANWPIASNECKTCFGCASNLTRGQGSLNPQCYLMSDFDIADVMSKRCFKDITCNTDCKFESDHAGVHNFVGGHMGNPSCAPADPVFFLHHAFIDCIWQWFRENSQETPIELEYPSWANNGDNIGSDRPSPPYHKPFLGYEWNAPMFPFWGLWNAHGISKFYEAYYSCKGRPMGCRSDKDCNGDTLWCDLKLRRCRAKIRKGGQCDKLPDNACDGTECHKCQTPACVDKICICQGYFCGIGK